MSACPCQLKGVGMQFLSPFKILPLLVVCVAVAHPVWAQDRGSVEGFGGWTIGQISTGGSSTEGSLFRSMNLGAKAAFDLTPGIQAVAEFGHMGNVLPPLVNTAISFLPYEVSVSAIYGAGGVPLLAAPHSSVTPYGEAIAGFSRLLVGIPGGAAAQTIADIALGFGGRTSPMVGLGAGILMRKGSLVVDLGYRYRQIFPNTVIETVSGADQGLRSSSIQAGIGVRF
jgi:hypothetical protein